MFFVFTAVGAFALVIALVTLRDAARAKSRSSARGLPSRLRHRFSRIRARVCFCAVFIEGIVIFGLFPFVALLLLAAGEPRASIAGIVLAGFSSVASCMP